MIETLHTNWKELADKYCKSDEYVESVWKEIQKSYTGKKRHYHNLNHISKMLFLANENEAEIVDKEAVLFSIWFHDIVYKSSKKDNEEKSAEFAEKTLKLFSIEEERIKKVSTLILSTKKHQILISEDNDNAYLLDFDLSILGQDWSIYEEYIKNIRKEYRMYPDFLYKPGRKKVLESFLNRDTLYFTSKYKTLFEEKARQNLKKEMKALS